MMELIPKSRSELFSIVKSHRIKTFPSDGLLNCDPLLSVTLFRVTITSFNKKLIAGAGRVGPRGLHGPPGPKGDTGDDGTPIGTVISFLGLTAPEGYLVCDGATYSIADYPALSAFIAAQFGSANHFGGDGTATFAVPDLRNLFLRGYHGAAEEQLSGDVGARQEATEHANVYIAASDVGNRTSGGLIGGVSPDSDSTVSRYQDRITTSNTKAFFIEPKQYTQFGVDIPAHYTARPVNMAVLYCIKAVKTVSSAPPPTASDVSYDNAASGLDAETVQGAVDEVAGKLAAGDVYSTEEVRIGTWMGKPMYKKCYVGVTPSDLNTSKSVISDGTTAAIEHCIDIGGSIKVETSANNKIDIAPNFYWHTSTPEDTQFISTFFVNGSINMNVSLSYSNKQFEIWITYTKTTDAAEEA